VLAHEIRGRAPVFDTLDGTGLIRMRR
jgi:hypothetical protein